MKPSSTKKRRTDTTISIRQWDSITPEILSLIFIHLPAEELIQSIQFVCKSWRETITGPYCWTQIDIESWCRRRNNQILIERGVIDLVRRSDGTCTSFSAFKLTNAAFSFVPHSLKYLKELKIPKSDVTDDLVIKHVASLQHLIMLDISSCMNITCKGVEALGKKCSSLVKFRRNMPPGWLSWFEDDEEALTIADTMPALQHLELGNGCFTDYGLDAILTKCKDLIYLDIIGCYGVKLAADFENKFDKLVLFRSPRGDEFERDVSDASDEVEESDEGEEDSSESDLDSEDGYLKRLKVLKIPMSDVTDKMLMKHVASLKLLTFVDISYCVKITCKGIEALGKSCTSLVRLRRNIPPPEWQQDIGALSSKKDDSEALVVANTMPGLCHLELAYGCFTDLGLDAILAKCRNLTRLDIIGCYGVKLEGDLEDRCGRLPMFRPPWDDDFF